MSILAQGPIANHGYLDAVCTGGNGPEAEAAGMIGQDRVAPTGLERDQAYPSLLHRAAAQSRADLSDEECRVGSWLDDRPGNFRNVMAADHRGKSGEGDGVASERRS